MPPSSASATGGWPAGASVTDTSPGAPRHVSTMTTTAGLTPAASVDHGTLRGRPARKATRMLCPELPMLPVAVTWMVSRRALSVTACSSAEDPSCASTRETCSQYWTEAPS